MYYHEIYCNYFSLCHAESDIGDSIADIALIARQVLQLPTVTQPQPEPRDATGLVISLVVAAIVLIFMLVVVLAFIIWCKFRSNNR